MPVWPLTAAGGERALRSDRELRGVDMFVYTDPAGLLGRLVGRCLRLRVGSFTFYVSRGGGGSSHERHQQKQQVYPATSTRLLRVEAQADSLRGECEVYARNHRATLNQAGRGGGGGADSSGSSSHVASAEAEGSAGAGDAAASATSAAVPETVDRVERLWLTYAEAERVRRRVSGAVLSAARHPVVEFEAERETPTTIEGTLHLNGVSGDITCAKSTSVAGEMVVRCPVSLRQFQLQPFRLWFGLFSVADTVEVETRVPARLLKL